MSEQLQGVKLRGADKRIKRIPIGERSQRRLANVPRDPNFYGRWVNDIDNNINDYKDAGYEFVEGKIDTRIIKDNEPSKYGSVISQHAGNGVRCYYMRLPIKYRNEDLLTKAEKVARSTQSAYDTKDRNFGRSYSRGNKGIVVQNITTANGRQVTSSEDVLAKADTQL